MKVIGAWFGRTGTMSLKVALQELGFGPCLHMIDLQSGYPGLSDTFREAYEGKQVDWREVLKDWRSTVDWPGCTFYREFMDVWPDAPVILTVRDPDSWYKSCADTIYQAAMAGINNPAMAQRPVSKMLKTLIWDGAFGGQFEDKQRTIEIFERHNQEVKEYVPQDRLLTFEVKEGWEPLCDFLGVDAPHRPFPHANDTQSFKEMVARGAHTSGEQVAALNKG